MGVLLNSIKPCFNWKASLHFPIIWSKLKADAHSLIKSLISVPGNQNSLSLLCRESFANCTQFQRFSKENLSMQSANCHSVNNCLNIQTTQQLPIKKINYRLPASKQTEARSWAALDPAALQAPLNNGWAGSRLRTPQQLGAEDKEQQSVLLSAQGLQSLQTALCGKGQTLF